jgi:hypothetical protein
VAGIQQVTSTKLDDQCFIEATIYHHRVKILVDSGAAHSCVANSFLKQLKARYKSLRKDQHVNLIGANGRPLSIIGTVELPIGIGDTTLMHTFFVVRDLYLKVLIGFNFLRENGAQIDVPGRTISFNDHTAITTLFTKHDTILALRESIIIPPFSEANVPLKIIGPYHGQTSIIQPLPTVGRLNIAVARAVVKPTGSVAVTNILNPTHKFIRLRRNTQVAFISPLDPCEYAIMPITSAPHVGMELVEPATHEIHEQTVKDLKVNINREELTDEQYRQLCELLHVNQKVFSRSIFDLPGTHLIEAELDTGDAKPIYKKQYKLPPAAMEEVNRQIKELLDAGLMEPSDSPWSSSAIIVLKRDGKSHRMCIDFRHINKVLRPTFQETLTLEQITFRLGTGSSSWFSQCDLRSGYYQIPIRKQDRCKTAVSTNDYHVQYTRLPFGIHLSGHLFNRLMSIVLRACRHSCAYVDDIITFSNSFPEHLTHLQDLFDRLRQARLKLHPAKSFFAMRKINYLGHTISEKGIEPDRSKVEVLRHVKAPTNQKELRSFLGAIGFFRRFVLHYSHKIAIFRPLLVKNAKWVWTPDHEKAFQDLKERLVQSPILRFPDFSKPMYLHTDASLRAISYCLMQREGGTTGPFYVISYGGRLLRKFECSWPISHLESLQLYLA